jgi:hypothetical protein
VSRNARKDEGANSLIRLLAQALRAALMKSPATRFRSPRDPAVAYAALIAPPQAEAVVDAARIDDLDHRIDALQRQLKALQRDNRRSDFAETQSDLSP